MKKHISVKAHTRFSSIFELRISKKSQMINHNLPRKIAIIKVITFYMATC